MAWPNNTYASNPDDPDYPTYNDNLPCDDNFYNVTSDFISGLAADMDQLTDHAGNIDLLESNAVKFAGTNRVYRSGSKTIVSQLEANSPVLTGTTYMNIMAKDGGGTLHTAAGFQVNGDLYVTGTLSKGAGSFSINHPVLRDRRLVHGFIEGPEYGLLYRGKCVLKNGYYILDIDSDVGMTHGTFSRLARHATIYLQNLSGFTPVRAIDRGDGVFDIIAKKRLFRKCNDVIAWLVCAERKDEFIMNSDQTDGNGHLILEPEGKQNG